MAERENIGALAVHFTAGVAAGTLLLRLPVSPYFLAGDLLIVLASLTAFVLRTERPALLFPTFLLVGAFCALADAFPGAETATFLERWASTLGGRLRDFIDSTPFPSESTAPLLKAGPMIRRFPADITKETFKGKERGGMNFDNKCSGKDGSNE